MFLFIPEEDSFLSPKSLCFLPLSLPTFLPLVNARLVECERQSKFRSVDILFLKEIERGL